MKIIGVRVPINERDPEAAYAEAKEILSASCAVEGLTYVREVSRNVADEVVKQWDDPNRTSRLVHRLVVQWEISGGDLTGEDDR